MTTQGLIASAINRGFVVADFEYLTVGMILDALTEFIPTNQRKRKATQEDFNKF